MPSVKEKLHTQINDTRKLSGEGKTGRTENHRRLECLIQDTEPQSKKVTILLCTDLNE